MAEEWNKKQKVMWWVRWGGIVGLILGISNLTTCVGGKILNAFTSDFVTVKEAKASHKELNNKIDNSIIRIEEKIDKSFKDLNDKIFYKRNPKSRSQ